MTAFIKFNKGMLKLPLPVQLWVLPQVVLNGMFPLVYLARAESKMIFLTFLVSFMSMVLITAVTGFTRLLGLGHVFWIPLLLVLWTRLDQIPADDLFGLWIRSLIVLNAASLVLDVVDVTRYIKGNRSEMVAGL